LNGGALTTASAPPSTGEMVEHQLVCGNNSYLV